MEVLSPKQLWQVALGALELQVTRSLYDTWLRATIGLDYRDDAFLVGAPSPFAVEYLEQRLCPLIRRTLMGLLGHNIEVRFVVQPSGAEPSLADVIAQGRQEPLTTTAIAVELRSETVALRPPPRFNPRYTYDTFVVSNGNRLAHAAVLGASERPGQGYNPVFIYGGVGLGKTHLLHSAGHMAYSQGYQVLYVSSEQFTNDFVNAIQKHQMEEFRSKYRNVDLLLIDDIQFLAEKERSQEEFFHTFNDLHGANRQIIISSDRSPRQMPLMLEDRLRSRFEWGLIADIQPPDLETRLAILQMKAEIQGVAVPSEVLELVAQRVQSNIRELEGSLNRVIALARLQRAPISVELALEVLGEEQPKVGPLRQISPKEVITAVAKHFRLSTEELKGRSRQHNLVLARQMAMYLMRDDGHQQLVAIGQELGGRDHSTVLHGCGKIVSLLNSDSHVRRHLQEIRQALYAKGR